MKTPNFFHSHFKINYKIWWKFVLVFLISRKRKRVRQGRLIAWIRYEMRFNVKRNIVIPQKFFRREHLACFIDLYKRDCSINEHNKQYRRWSRCYFIGSTGLLITIVIQKRWRSLFCWNGFIIFFTMPYNNFHSKIGLNQPQNIRELKK